MKAGLRRQPLLVPAWLGALCMFVGGSGFASAQDLVALAKKEKARRAKIAAPRKVLTEADVAARTGGAAPETPAEAVTPMATDQPAPAASAADAEALQAQWRTRAEAARAAVTSAEQTLAQLELELSTFRSDLTQVPAAEAQDPLRLQKREARIAEMQKQVQAQKNQVAAAKAALSAFEDEARRAGVPAGWLR